MHPSAAEFFGKSGACALFISAATHAQVSVTELPTLGVEGVANAVSSDGTIVVGTVYSPSDPTSPLACRWNLGMLELLPSIGIQSEALDVSADGTVVVGYAFVGNDYVGVQWRDGVASVLPRNGSYPSFAFAVSSDGTTIAGYLGVDTPTGAYCQCPALWQNGVIRYLEHGTENFSDGVRACSADGSVAAGAGPSSAPVQWTSAGMIPLETNQSQPWANQFVTGMSGDGHIIVGYQDYQGRPVRWTNGALGYLPSPFSSPSAGQANDASTDGSVIGGKLFDPNANGGVERAVLWTSAGVEVLPTVSDCANSSCNGVSPNGTVAVGWGNRPTSASSCGFSERRRPLVWDLCPNALAGGQCNAPPQATNLPFEGRVVTDPDHPLDFTLQIADNDPSQTVTLQLDPADLAALTSIGYSVQITHNTNPAMVHVWQETSLDLGWAEREWRLRINASDSQSTTVNNPIDLFVHRRSFLPPRRLLDGHPSTLTPLAQWDARWGFQRTGATDDTPAPALDLIRDWVSGVRADMAAIPLQNAGDPVDAAIVRRWFTQSICNNQPCGFTSDPANWIDHPVLVATALSVVWPGAGGQKAEQVWLNVPLQYVSGPRASVYPHANITTRAGSVVSVDLVPTERGSGFEAPSGTTFTVLPAMLGGVAGFFCSVSATTLEPNGVHGDKNDILEIARLVEARRPNNNLRLIGCCLTSCIMAGNAMMTGELPQVAHEWTPGEAHTALRTPALAWMTRPGPTEKIKLDRWRGSETSNAVPGRGPRFVNGFCVVWDQIERWFNSQGAPIKLVRVTRSCGPNCTENVPLTEAVVREHLDQRRALVFFNGEHWRMISKYDFGGANGALRVFVSDPGTGAQQWLTLAQAGGTNLKGFATVERTSSAQQFNAQATDFEAYATGAERILVTDSAGRKAGIDPTTGEVFGDATSGIAFDAPLDFPGYAPLTDEEWAQRTAESLRRVTMTGTVPTGTYVIDVDNANTTVNIAWRQAGQPVHTESFTPFPTAWGGRVVLQVTVAGACPADLNGDGVVGAQDIAILLGNWGGTGPADLDGNGVVGSSDIAILLGAWGGC